MYIDNFIIDLFCWSYENKTKITKLLNVNVLRTNTLLNSSKRKRIKRNEKKERKINAQNIRIVKILLPTK